MIYYYNGEEHILVPVLNAVYIYDTGTKQAQPVDTFAPIDIDISWFGTSITDISDSAVANIQTPTSVLVDDTFIPFSVSLSFNVSVSGLEEDLIIGIE